MPCCACFAAAGVSSLPQHRAARHNTAVASTLPCVSPCPLASLRRRQLDILSSSEGGERGSLLWLLDHTLTAGGGRLLRKWVARPLRSKAAIDARLDAVQELLQSGREEGRVGVGGVG